MFIPTHAKRFERRVEGACAWCCKWQPLKVMTKARDGPVDHYFCGQEHCAAWGRAGFLAAVTSSCSRRASGCSIRPRETFFLTCGRHG